MPKSKRQKLVSLTKTAKHGRKAKESLVEDVRNSLEVHSDIYLLAMRNPRNQAMKEVRAAWAGSRFYFGKNKLLALALGSDASSEAKANLHLLAKDIKGDRGLFFTNSPQDQVQKFFSEFKDEHFARSGLVADRTFSVPAGLLPQFSFAMEPQLRKLGLPTKLNNGVIELEAKVTVCQTGDVLSPEQCRILELFGQKLAHTHFIVYGRWSGDKYERLAEDEPEPDDEEEERMQEE
eukprot:gb/GEZN01017603.1/.p1 GENE.gb/GEZN01017603.1/~~gb/GEZN01017603.1/.p1  ORF type:complete len:235 (+),score=39.12 gb/GEZN01017603.1/:31-735(+)